MPMLSSLVTSPGFARLPVRIRRSAIRSFWRSQVLIRQTPDFGLVPVFQRMLRMPLKEAQRLQQEVAFQDMIATAGWAVLLHYDMPLFLRDRSTIAVSDEAVLAQVARDGKPVILAPLHAGSFALPFAKLMFEHFRDRRMLILRAREDRPEETEVMRRISTLGIEMRFLNIAHKENYVDAIRYAKAGAVIVCFCDLPGRYGSPFETTLFGQPAELAMGIGSLARVTGATVVPVSIASGVSGDHVAIGKPFESYRAGKDERVRVAGLIRRHLETAISADPAQWHMWPRIGEYLKPAFIEEAAA